MVQFRPGRWLAPSPPLSFPLWGRAGPVLSSPLPRRERGTGCSGPAGSGVTSPNQRHLEPESATGPAGGAAGHGLASGTCRFAGGGRGGTFLVFSYFHLPLSLLSLRRVCEVSTASTQRPGSRPCPGLWLSKREGAWRPLLAACWALTARAPSLPQPRGPERRPGLVSPTAGAVCGAQQPSWDWESVHF